MSTLFDGVVFDLDGTLVELDVDWQAARTEISNDVGDYLERPVREYAAADLFDTARTQGVYDELVSILTTYELDGARQATSLPLLTVLEDLSCPIGICTANATGAAERALERFGVRDAVDVIVGRDTLMAHKPSPEPLLACLEDMHTEPGNAVFIGDTAGDAETASRAGTSFLASDQFTVGHP